MRVQEGRKPKRRTDRPMRAGKIASKINSEISKT
jgi:hypothetical protein